MERVADRWLFGEVGSDARLIDTFGAAAEHAGRSEVLELLVATARRALRLRWARASTRGVVPVVAAVGVGTDELRPAAARFPLIESGEQLGLLECGPKRGGPLNAHDRQLLGALGREAALRLRTVSQADELEARLRQIERQAAEIAASRARIVEAQDEERRRIERDIHDGVQQELASLIGKLRLAINQIAVAPEDAAATIAGAQDDVRRTLADVRAIAQGIHPAILDDQGIVRAIEARAKRLPLEVSVDADPELAGRRFDRRIEGAAYFVASEALANIVKHAEATAGDRRAGRRRRPSHDPRRRQRSRPRRRRRARERADQHGRPGGRARWPGHGRGQPDRRHDGGRRAAARSYCCCVTLRVVIAEDNKVYREGVRAVLEFGGEFEVVAAVDRPEALLEQVDELQPDAVITDIRMPPTHHMEGIEAAHEIRRRHPHIGILVLSQHADDSYAFELLKDGTAGLGYLLKERIGDDDGAIARAAAGRSSPGGR